MPIQKFDIPGHGSVEGEFEVRYWKSLNTPVSNAAGDLVCILHSVEDVTEPVLKQQAAEAGEARFRQVADAMPQMVWSLTGYGQAHDRVLAKAAGYDHYFVKPVDMTALQRVLTDVAPTVHAS